MVVDQKPPATAAIDTARSVRWAPGRARTAGLTVLALALAAWVASGWGPAQAVGGALLVCYLPGRLALEALRRPGAPSDPPLDNVVAVALSLVATMLLGAVAAGFRLGFTSDRMALLASALCLALGVTAFVRTPATAPPTTGEPAIPARTLRWFSPWVALAALPAVVLSVLLAVQVTGYVRHRPADSYYTELSVVTGGGTATVVITSRERAMLDFRCEERLNGVLVRQDRFALGPGRSSQLPVSLPGTGRVEILLFRGTEPTVYRRLIL